MAHDKLILIAHFDPAGKLSRDWLTLIDALRAGGFADLMLVSTGLNAAPYRDRLAGVRVVVRENVGYDFYSWRQGLLDAFSRGYEQVVLLNTSFYVADAGRFSALLRQPMPLEARVRALTISWQDGFHAQSYFLQFARSVLESAVFNRFWQEMRPVSSRQTVIDLYELGLSRQLGREFPIEPIFALGPYEKFLMLRRGLKDSSKITAAQLEEAYDLYKQSLNPSLLLWDCLLYRYGIVKKQLVHENPFGAPIDEVRDFVARCILN
ncbi:MAG: rhamnan synthesis F family protein [Steroidobacteraceae bacterium]|jgi:rhamnosyltransferase